MSPVTPTLERFDIAGACKNDHEHEVATYGKELVLDVAVGPGDERER